MIMVMEVTTENGEVTPSYLLHGGERDVQVTHSGLCEAFSGLTLLQEGETAAGLLAGVSHLERQHCLLLVLWSHIQIRC